jgi:hypothetical protein
MLLLASSSSSSYIDPHAGDKTTGVPLPSGYPQFGIHYDNLYDDADLFGEELTDAEASRYSFAQLLVHYMERFVVCEGNCRAAVELVIMIEVGTMVRDRHQMKKRGRMFLSEYVKIICLISDDNFEGPKVCQEMLLLNSDKLKNVVQR